MSKETVRMTVVLPAETAKKLRELVPTRKRSEFITEAVEQHLMRIICRQGREFSFGAWSDEAYPHLRSHDDVPRYIAGLRDKDQWRWSARKER
jgi:metal-responsive CopG/Arc/MetJ family transcriptional regulator